MLSLLMLLAVLLPLSCTPAEPELESTLTLPIEAFLSELSIPGTVDGAFERYAFRTT